MLHRSKIRSGFDLLAPFYDLLSRSFFGNAILNSQTYFFSEFKRSNSVMIFGGGTGKLLIECLKHDIGNEYTYVDLSPKMLSKTKQRIAKYRAQFGNDKKIEFICGSYQHIATDKKFDLIITPYVLDCFAEKELAEVMIALNEKLSPNGKWSFIDFNIPNKGVMQITARSIIRMLYFFFDLVCGLGIKKLPSFQKHFEAVGLNIEKERSFLNGMLCAKVYSHS